MSAYLQDSRATDSSGRSLTYAHYNYLRPGLISMIKRRRFEIALRLLQPKFGGTVIDMGCADGVLLPSLARHFAHVIAFDIYAEVVDTAKKAVAAMHLDSVRVINNQGLSNDQLRSEAPELPADCACLLETLEHIGTPGGSDLYGEKVQFLRDLFGLLKPGGLVVVSVPRMVGWSLLAKYAVQSVMRANVEPISPADLFRSGVMKNTDTLEPTWDRGHNGFNDEKLGRALAEHFVIHRKLSTAISRFFLLSAKP